MEDSGSLSADAGTDSEDESIADEDLDRDLDLYDDDLGALDGAPSEDDDEEDFGGLTSFESQDDSDVEESPSPPNVAPVPRRIPTSPSSSKSFGAVTPRVPLIQRTEPVTYTYPGDPYDIKLALEGIEDVVNEEYPDGENNDTIARCVLFHLLYKSYYPPETQEKIERVLSVFVPNR